MPQTRSKTRSKTEDYYYSDESIQSIVLEKDHKDQSQRDHLLMIHEDPDGESPNQSSTKQQKMQLRKHSKHYDYPFEVEINQEYTTSPIHSSLMDLEDICSDTENNFASDFEDEPEWLDRYLNKSKEKTLLKNKKKPKPNESNPVKIQENLPNNQEKQSGYKGNRKIRTTISEEKIKIMEHLFPFVLNGKPYKGTVLSLKDVAKIVDLGYSTILHKYKDFRQSGQIHQGLLLKCKDFKRKYNKSLIIENHIKKALKEGEFKTAKNLASFIQENYNIKVNRSIISRHLNQMQREKSKLQEKKLQIPGKKKSYSIVDDILQKLKEFCLVFLGLHKQKVSFCYFALIRLYLVEGRLSFYLKNQDENFKVINLSITATETELKQYYPHFVNDTEMVLAKNLKSLDSGAYKLLYRQLENYVESNDLDIQISNDADRTYVIFPYKSTLLKESQYRYKKLEDFMNKKISVLTIPPEFKIKNINFIRRWFSEEVMIELEDMEFESIDQCKECIINVMNIKQKTLQAHSNKMINSFKNF